MTKAVFIHGLESSSRGRKASWFKGHYPGMIIPDFTGSLADRLEKLNTVLDDYDELIMIGSSFGGMMATVFALENEDRVREVILLAPALNFPEFAGYLQRSTAVPARLYIGSDDTVCPPSIVTPLAKQVFKNLEISETAEDHYLQKTFHEINWRVILADAAEQPQQKMVLISSGVALPGPAGIFRDDPLRGHIDKK